MDLESLLSSLGSKPTKEWAELRDRNDKKRAAKVSEGILLRLREELAKPWVPPPLPEIQPVKELSEEEKEYLAELRKEDHRTYHALLRLQAIRLLGGRCSNCGFEDYRALQIDHINGGGLAEAKEKGLPNILRRIIYEPEVRGTVYQCLCANCNWIKRAEQGELLYYK